MFSTLILGVGLLVRHPAESVAAKPEDSRRMKPRKTAGRDAAGQVTGTGAQRMGWRPSGSSTWAVAMLSDPRDATARGLLGLVDYNGRWSRPEDVSATVRADAALLGQACRV